MKKSVLLILVVTLMFPVLSFAGGPSLKEYSQTLLSLKRNELVRLQNGETGVEGYALFGTTPPIFLLTGNVWEDQLLSSQSRTTVLNEEISFLENLLAQLNQSQNNTHGGGSGQNNSVYPSADSHVYAYSYLNWNNANWGNYDVLGAGWHPAGGEKRAFLKFNLSGINPNTFKKATLKLYHYHTGGGNAVDLGVYRVMGPWTEGRGTYKPATQALAGELTWMNQPSIDRYPIVYFNPGSNANKWVEIDITSLVNAWLTGVPNYGLVLKGGENLTGKPESQYGFRSREDKDSNKRPYLTISGSGEIIKPIASVSGNGANQNDFNIGSAWQVVESCGDTKWMGTWIRRPGTNTFDATWKNVSSGQVISDVIDFKGVNNGKVTLYRHGTTGTYTGELSYDGQHVRDGGASWYHPGCSWTAEIVTGALKADNGGKVVSTQSISGKWNLNQSNGYNGTMTLQQTQLGQLTGSAIWNGHLKGSIVGSVSGNAVTFTISYPSGIKGFYKGTLTQNGIQIVNGTANATNGGTATWNGSKATFVKSISGSWKVKQSTGHYGTLRFQQNAQGVITGTAAWNGNLNGTIDGTILGNKIEFAITYPSNVVGVYKGTLSQNNTEIIKGTVKGSNGVTATWNASR